MHKIKVKRYDSPLRYIATSEEHGDREQYLVDLGEWSCTCRHFECRLAPKLKEGGKRRKHSCKHQRAVLLHFATHWIDVLIQLEKEQDRERRKNPFVVGGSRCE